MAHLRYAKHIDETNTLMNPIRRQTSIRYIISVCWCCCCKKNIHRKIWNTALDSVVSQQNKHKYLSTLFLRYSIVCISEWKIFLKRKPNKRNEHEYKKRRHGWKREILFISFVQGSPRMKDSCYILKKKIMHLFDQYIHVDWTNERLVTL